MCIKPKGSVFVILCSIDMGAEWELPEMCTPAFICVSMKVTVQEWNLVSVMIRWKEVIHKNATFHHEYRKDTDHKAVSD